MNGALLVCGTASDAGKSVVVAGICRWLARQGVKVAPFKAQNMALNSVVTLDGAEIGRAQAMQAAAARVEPEAAMNPVLLKPTGDRTSQVIVMGHPNGVTDAVSYQARKPALLHIALAALEDLRSRFDVVICEGAGSPAEINLRDGDFVNMGLARAANLPVVVVGDIDRGGVFAALYGTLALLEPADQALVKGWLINKFRGDPALLDPGLDRLQELTGRPVLGVLPYQEGLWLDAEDSLALESRPAPKPNAALDVAVVRLRRISNFTDVDALAAEPGVRVRFTTDPVDVERADLAILPGTKATVEDLALVRDQGIADALTTRADQGHPVLGICGGYQMLGRWIHDEVESGVGTVKGLNLLPVATAFAPEKTLTRRTGTCPLFGGVEATGYEIRHGHTCLLGGTAFVDPDGGCADGAVLGTSWHGLLEGDALRRALLAWVADRRGLDFVPATTNFANVREAGLDVLGDLIEHHADVAALEAVISG
ncbi:MAG: cobyric acid synthase [Egibacteraceae bacterium]